MVSAGSGSLSATTVTGSGTSSGSSGSGFLSTLFSTPSKRMKDARRYLREGRDGGKGKGRAPAPFPMPLRGDRESSASGRPPLSRASASASASVTAGSGSDRSLDFTDVNTTVGTGSDAGLTTGPGMGVAPELCLRINVRSVAKYRLCDSNPQDEGEATWAVVTGTFQQSFLLRYGSSVGGTATATATGGTGGTGAADEVQRLVVSDRVVTVDMRDADC